MTDKKMTLGQRILAARAEAVADPIEAAHKKAEKAGKGKAFSDAVAFFVRFKKLIADSVEAGDTPPWVEFTSEEDVAFEGYSWYRLTQKGDSTPMPATHYTHPLWMEFLKWAKEQDLQVRWRGCHDGGGIRSWGEVTVVPVPVPVNFTA